MIDKTMKIKVVCPCGEEVTEQDYQQLLRDMVEEGIIREIAPQTFQLNSMFTLYEKHRKKLKIPLCSMSPKFLKLLKRGHENASRGSLANPPLASICA